MAALRVALVAAILGAVAWWAKGVAIAGAEGLDRSSLESPLYFAGMLGMLVAFCALGAGLSRTRPVWQRSVVGVVTMVCAVGTSVLVQAGVGSVFSRDGDAGWVPGEAGLWLVGLLAIGITYLALRGVTHRKAPERAPSPRRRHAA